MCAAAPISVEYARDLTRWGVRIIEDEHQCTILVPPLPSWHMLPRGYFIGIAILFGVVTFIIAMGMQNPTGFEGLTPPIIMYTLALALLFMLAWRRLHLHTILTVTDRHFTLIRRLGFGKPLVGTWPRDQITELRYSTISAKLIIRIPDHDAIELSICPEPRVCEAIAQTLSDAIKRPFTPVPEAESPTLTLKARPAKATAFRWFLNIAILALVIGVVVATFFLPVLFLLLLPLAVIAGLHFGSQPREYYI